MDLILVKIFAAALALSEVMTQPQAVKTHFDPVTDRTEVVQILRNGCAHMRAAFDIESINLDSLIATALDDPKAVGADSKAFHGINFADLNTAYRQFCKDERVDNPAVDLGQVILFFNDAATDLPDQTRLKDRKLPSMSAVLDGKGQNFADIFEPGNRRIWVSLADIPDYVQKAFVAAEDRRFFQHHGVDERGIIRAFIGNLADPGRPQGGSTITQQVVKNLLVGEDVTYERKIREMIVASRVESTLSKPEILELYLNSAYLGRGSWGVEMSARSYFGKSAKNLTLAEAAMLAGLLKGPNYFNPDRHPERAKERLAYVLGRMQEDGVISSEQKDQALAVPPKLVAFERPHRDSGFHFIDYLGREAKADGVGSLTAESYTVHSTINAALQRDTEAALQEGLAHYELTSGRMQFRGAEANIAEAVQKIAADKQADPQRAQGLGPNAAVATSAALPAWQQALVAVRLPLYDVHWEPAVVLDKGGKRGEGVIHVGLADGRILPLNAWTWQIRQSLSLYDVVYVSVAEAKAAAKGKTGATSAMSSAAQAQLRVRPIVQGAALVLENKTGRILAMAGSFSYPLSQLNRAAQTQRQPGSAIKPLTYLTALQSGLQPNTLVPDDPITLPPIGGGIVDGRDIIMREVGGTIREQDFWTPRNADNYAGGVFTLRRGLENSVNIVTAHLLDGGISSDPQRSLSDVCATAVAAKIYTDCIRYYPFVLGAQPVRMIDLAAFYAAVANEGALPQPHAIDSIEAAGRTVYQYPNAPLPMIGAADRVAFYQLKTMLQGVVARGTARAIASLSPYVAGKTGTTEDAVDGWFIGFTNDVTVAVWVGYDNGDGKRRSLGSNATGARVALPIFEPIMKAIWAEGIAPKAPLGGPSREAQRYLIDLPIDYMTGDRVTGGGFIEHFRRAADGRFDETQYRLVSRDEPYASGFWGGDSEPADDASRTTTGRSYYPDPGWQPPPLAPLARGLLAPFLGDPDGPRSGVRRDQDYIWGRPAN
ncbi:MAG TPA: transglycosylase domain-containing protein [Xanthobacteraceae bacterium]|nr:transglycosylase domain-containing protein [Xanthobacteraceae bacterium]